MADETIVVEVDVPTKIREAAARRAIESNQPDRYEAFILDYIQIELNLTAV